MGRLMSVGWASIRLAAETGDTFSCISMGSCRQVVERIDYASISVCENDFGLMNIMPLHEVESELEQDGHRVRILDALGNRFDLALVGGFDDLADRTLHRLVGHERMHELAVDLDIVGFQQIENLESLTVNAVMLDGEADAELAQVLDQRFGLLDVLGKVLIVASFFNRWADHLPLYYMPIARHADRTMPCVLKLFFRSLARQR